MKLADLRTDAKIIENVSRRGFLQGALASGVLVLTARFVSEPLFAAEGETRPRSIRACGWESHRMER